MDNVAPDTETSNPTVAQSTNTNALTIAWADDDEPHELRKRIVLGDAGTPVSCGAISMPLEWAFAIDRVVDIDDLRALLTGMRGEPRACIIRGRPLAERGRRMSKGAGATIEDVPRAWLMVDIDRLATPAGVEFVREPARCAEYARSLLPEPFRASACVWQASGSAGCDPAVIKLHLWFLLDQPLYGVQCADWLCAASEPALTIDRAVYVAVQPHFTADPVLDGVDDPMSERIGKLDGAARVAVPELLPALERKPTSTAKLTLVRGSGELRPRPEGWQTLTDEQLADMQVAAEREIDQLETLTGDRIAAANRAGACVGRMLAETYWAASADPNDMDADMREYADKIADAIMRSPQPSHDRAKYRDEALGGIVDIRDAHWAEMQGCSPGQRWIRWPLPTRAWLARHDAPAGGLPTARNGATANDVDEGRRGYHRDDTVGMWGQSTDMIAQKIIRMNCRPETAQIRYARSHGFFARVGGDTWQLVERPLAQLSAALDALRDTAIGEGAKGALARQRESLPKLATYVESFAQSEQGIQSQVRESLSAQRTTFDPRANKLLVAVCPLRTDLVPEYSAAADDWATNLCGGRCYTRPGDPAPQYELLLDWIAVLTLLDASAPLLYMRGAAQLGKSAFVNGLARLWREAGPAQLANCFGRFNGELTACPLSFADEVFPKDENGRPNTQIFRRFNEARNHSVERKYKEIVSVVGCTRQVAAENGTDMFDFRGQEITADDVVAIGSRLLVIDCFAEACEPGFVRRRYDFSDMESLVESDAFARWALWLRDNHKVTSGRGVRGLCRSNGQSFVRAAANSSGLRAKLLQHAVESVILMADSKPLKRIVSGVACDGGRVGVNTLRISKLQSLPVFDGAPNVAQLQTALQAIRGPKREVFKPRCRADEAESEATRSEYTVILAAELTRAAAELGRGDDYAAALAKLSR